MDVHRVTLPRLARALALPAVVLAAYAWLFPWLPALRSPNELSRLYQARAIAEDRSLSVNSQLARHGPVGDLSVKDGRYYPNKAPGLSFLGAAVLAGLGSGAGEAEAVFWSRLLACMLPGAVAAELLRRILARCFDPGLAASGAVVFALGTIAWPYSTFLMSHGPTASALVASWWSIEKASEWPSPVDGPAQGGRSRSVRWSLLAGFMAGWAVLLEYTSLLAVLPLLVFSLARQRERSRVLAAMLAGLLPPLLVLVVYHRAAFGHPFHTGYAHLVNPVFQAWHARGFMGVGAPSLRALAGSLFDPARGLLAWSPFLALGIPGLALLRRRDGALALLCAFQLVLYALFTASFTYEAWGWSVGPRHVTPLCPFLVPPALATAAWLRDRGLGFVGGGLALFGVAVQALTVSVCPYLPEELTNPMWQLVIPLARSGLRSPDVLAMTLGTRSAWTLAPWLALVCGAALWMAWALSSERAGRARASGLVLSLLLATALLHAQSRLGGPDRFEGTRRFMAAHLSGAAPHRWP